MECHAEVYYSDFHGTGREAFPFASFVLLNRVISLPAPFQARSAALLCDHPLYLNSPEPFLCPCCGLSARVCPLRTLDLHVSCQSDLWQSDLGVRV